MADQQDVKIAILETKVETIAKDISEIRSSMKSISESLNNGKGSFVKAIVTSSALGSLVTGLFMRFFT